MKIIIKNGTGEIVEKKSRFIANVFSINNEEEAQEILTFIKKKYWDARHNCFAYVLGKNNEIQKFSDDGEPSQTAGKPIMEVINGEEIHNCLIVVTRYFGGTLLGTGGLIRAYTAAAKAGIEESVVKNAVSGALFKIHLDYGSSGKLQYICGELDVKIIETVYDDKVHMTMAVPQEMEGRFAAKVTDSFSGSIIPEKIKDAEYYCSDSGEVVVL